MQQLRTLPTPANACSWRMRCKLVADNARTGSFPIKGVPVGEQTSEKRRAHVRRLLQVAASLSNESRDRNWCVRLIDIARMGAGFVTSEQLPEDVHYYLSFRFPDSDITDEVLVRIVYCRAIGTEGQFHYGARIHVMSEACVDRIVDYVTRSDRAALEARR